MRKLFLALMLATALLARADAARSFIVVDDLTGHVLASGNENEKLQIGSLTKIATAMVVMDWADATRASLAAEVPVPPGVQSVGGMNPCGLQPGDMVSLRDLIYAAMMVSDNHAAYTLAHNVGERLPNPQQLGPVDNFTAHMNALARTLGMKRTIFLNPHGLDNMETPPHSTATDLARLTRYAYKHAGFNFYVSQPAREISITGADGTKRGFLLRNTNEVLGQDGIDGVKTGRTARAGDCLVLSADQAPATVDNNGQTVAIPRRIIVVLLASPDRFGEGLQLVRRAWELHAQWSAEGRPVSRRSSI
ncbi:MAG: D-alanyl-D-alanine carboxypeptidase [Chthoniobacterales bacterium]|nr:D-alanyl-D-alanine carboxypeptidase [Chthoniobacterales bacterium]